MARFHVLIPAAGNGSRMAHNTPKQYLKLHGKALIHHVIQVFESCPRIVHIHVVISPHDTHWYHQPALLSPKLKVTACGADTRAGTVLNGLQAMRAQVDDDDWLLVHDAARPGLSLRLLDEFLNVLAQDAVGGLLALPVADTLKRADAEGCVLKTVPRNDLWQAQTPQMFRYATLKKALTNFEGTPTDEAEAIEALGLRPKLVRGELQNLKVTYPQDLTVLAAWLKP